MAQLRAAFEAFTEWTKPVETIEPDERSAYLKTVLQNAKAEFPSSVRPIRHKDKDFAEFRYFRIPGSATWYAVGVARPVENLADHEVWLRFHKVTGEFERVREVLLSSSLASKVRIHRKHVWLPLKVEAGLSSIALGESLVAQTREILDVIRVGGPQDDLLGRESTDGGPSE